MTKIVAPSSPKRSQAFSGVCDVMASVTPSGHAKGKCQTRRVSLGFRINLSKNYTANPLFIQSEFNP